MSIDVMADTHGGDYGAQHGWEDCVAQDGRSALTLMALSGMHIPVEQY